MMIIAKSYGFVFADTYSEIESGQVVDYFCEKDIKFNSNGNVLEVPFVVSCLAHRCTDPNLMPTDSVTIVNEKANVGDGASTYFICDPS